MTRLNAHCIFPLKMFLGSNNILLILNLKPNMKTTPSTRIPDQMYFACVRRRRRPIRWRVRPGVLTCQFHSCHRWATEWTCSRTLASLAVASRLPARCVYTKQSILNVSPNDLVYIARLLHCTTIVCGVIWFQSWTQSTYVPFWAEFNITLTIYWLIVDGRTTNNLWFKRDCTLYS